MAATNIDSHTPNPNDFEEGPLAGLAEQFLCPISHELMSYPVIAADGHSYDRANIETWMREQTNGQPSSPMTGAPLDNPTLIPNHALRTAIESFKEAHGIVAQLVNDNKTLTTELTAAVESQESLRERLMDSTLDESSSSSTPSDGRIRSFTLELYDLDHQIQAATRDLASYRIQALFLKRALATLMQGDKLENEKQTIISNLQEVESASRERHTALKEELTGSVSSFEDPEAYGRAQTILQQMQAITEAHADYKTAADEDIRRIETRKQEKAEQVMVKATQLERIADHCEELQDRIAGLLIQQKAVAKNLLSYTESRQIMLPKHQTDTLATDTTDESKQHELMEACERGDFDAVTALISSGADLSLTDKDGRTALGSAIWGCCPSLVEWLLDQELYQEKDASIYSAILAANISHYGEIFPPSISAFTNSQSDNISYYELHRYISRYGMNGKMKGICSPRYFGDEGSSDNSKPVQTIIHTYGRLCEVDQNGNVTSKKRTSNATDEWTQRIMKLDDDQHAIYNIIMSLPLTGRIKKLINQTTEQFQTHDRSGANSSKKSSSSSRAGKRDTKASTNIGYDFEDLSKYKCVRITDQKPN